MENTRINGAVVYAGYETEATRKFSYRNEVIDCLSRAPVKVQHWLLTNDTFQVGLEALNPASAAWVQDEKLRELIRNGLVRMVTSAIEFVKAFPDANILKA